jgi:coniferyl-aldehyde dehydrogenase
MSSELERAYEQLKDAYRADMFPSTVTRRRQLQVLEGALVNRRQEIARAIDADFGGRSKHETLIAEVYICVQGLRHAAKHLHRWMQPQPRRVGLPFLPGRARVHYQPLGVVGVISPWNYPVQLAVLPVAIALAAGNKVMLKPSEFTPRTSELLQEIFEQVLPETVRTVLGGVDVGVAFSQLPFDHLFYTGSTGVGRLVMAAAAKNLTPVTLELGGKSPALVHREYDLAEAAGNIMAGKLFNAGQTCIAPDYVLVPREQEEAFVEAAVAAAGKLYPRLANNEDYTSIVNDHHHRRLLGYVEDAVAKGARQAVINPENESLEGLSHKMAPRILFGVTDEMSVMRDEIFGPILPVVTYDTLGGALDYINDRPRPLAFYYFDNLGTRTEEVLKKTISGGVCVNDCLLHVAQEDLPFGGVGASGMGSYHGFDGFETMSHKRGVFLQSRFAATRLFQPPYGKTVERLLKVLL